MSGLKFVLIKHNDLTQAKKFPACYAEQPGKHERMYLESAYSKALQKSPVNLK